MNEGEQPNHLGHRITLVTTPDGESVRLPIPTKVEDETVYHYTTGGGLLGIMEQHAVWASSPLGLNDLSEFSYGVEIVNQEWRRREQSGVLSDAERQYGSKLFGRGSFDEFAANVFFFSASRERDALNQWQGYAGQKGFAIGLRTEALRLHHATQKQTGGRSVSRLRSGWYDVVYDPQAQVVLANGMIDFLLKYSRLDAHVLTLQWASSLMATLVAQFKHPGFAVEREVRYIMGRPKDMRELYRPGRYGIVPYVELFAENRSNNPSVPKLERKPLPIREVICGPTDYRELSLLSSAVRRMAETFGYGPQVRWSEVPARW